MEILQGVLFKLSDFLSYSLHRHTIILIYPYMLTKVRKNTDIVLEQMLNEAATRNIYWQHFLLLHLSMDYQSILQSNCHFKMRKFDEHHDPEPGVTSIFGIYFCQRCRNIITPLRANGNSLEFTCQTCGTQDIDFTSRYHDDCILSNKELQSTYSKKYIFDESHVFDPTLSLTEVTCPQCGHNRAIYTLAADEDETKFVARMMCANVQGTTIKCCHTWELDEFDDLNEDGVVINSEREQENELM